MGVQGPVPDNASLKLFEPPKSLFLISNLKFVSVDLASKMFLDMSLLVLLAASVQHCVHGATLDLNTSRHPRSDGPSNTTITSVERAEPPTTNTNTVQPHPILWSPQEKTSHPDSKSNKLVEIRETPALRISPSENKPLPKAIFRAITPPVKSAGIKDFGLVKDVSQEKESLLVHITEDRSGDPSEEEASLKEKVKNRGIKALIPKIAGVLAGSAVVSGAMVLCFTVRMRKKEDIGGEQTEDRKKEDIGGEQTEDRKKEDIGGEQTEDRKKEDIGGEQTEDRKKEDIGGEQTEDRKKEDIGGEQTEDRKKEDIGGEQTEDRKKEDIGGEQTEDRKKEDIGGEQTEDRKKEDIGGEQTEDIPVQVGEAGSV